MKFEAAKIRNFVVAGHSGSGKTSLCDLMLYKSKAVDRLGSVDAKTSVSDFTPDEQDKRSSVYSSCLNCEWQGDRFFFADTPGYGEFVGEAIASFAAADGVLIAVDGVNGLEVGATRAWKLAKDAGQPHAIFVNRLDKEMSDFHRVVDQLHDAFGKSVCVPLTIPVGSQDSLKGVLSILGKPEPSSELKGFADECKEALMDAIAGSDDKLIEKYLDGKPLTDEELLGGLRKAIFSGSLVPVFAGSVAKDVGVSELMDGLASLFPSPLERAPFEMKDGSKLAPSDGGDATAFVFKTLIDPFVGQLSYFRVLSGQLKADSDLVNLTSGAKERFGQLFALNGKAQTPLEEACAGCVCAVAKLKGTKTGDTLCSVQKGHPVKPMAFPSPVMSYALAAVKSGDEDKMMSSIAKISEGDPTLKVGRNAETHEVLLKGMGDQHLSLAVKKLKDVYKVDVTLSSPKIPYRETVTGHGDGHYRHKKQTGGHGQFAEVYLKVDAKPDGYEFVNSVVGGTIPRNFIPAVEKGVLEAMERGPLAGCSVEKMKVSVYDGKYHDVDSSEMAFKIAARMAFRDAMAKAKPVLLEPVMNVKIMVPERYMGEITGNLNHKRGRILGMEAEEGLEVVKAEVPMAEMAKYATELRSITQGSGSFEMEFARYEVVPGHVASEIIAKHQATQGEEL